MGRLVSPHHLGRGTPMKLAILSRAPQAYSTQRLRAAALQRGHQVKVLNTLRFAIDLSGHEPDLQYRGDCSPTTTRSCRASATRSPTSARLSCASSSRWTSTRPTPRTASRTPATSCGRPRSCPATTSGCRPRRSCTTAPMCGSAIERVGGAPVVIKLLEGTQGIGVILAPEVEDRRGDHRDAALARSRTC